jgi:hypothetical protein
MADQDGMAGLKKRRIFSGAFRLSVKNSRSLPLQPMMAFVNSAAAFKSSLSGFPL